MPVLPRLLKLVIFALFHAVLPPEARIQPDVRLEHYGLGIVVHPNTTIGRGVKIWHNVTLAAETTIGSPSRLTVEDGVMIGASAQIIARVNEPLVLGRGASVGAGAVVTRSVPPGAVVVGVPREADRARADLTEMLRIGMYHCRLPEPGRKPGGVEVFVDRLGRRAEPRAATTSRSTRSRPTPARRRTRCARCGPHGAGGDPIVRQYLAPWLLNIRPRLPTSTSSTSTATTGSASADRSRPSARSTAPPCSSR